MATKQPDPKPADKPSAKPDAAAPRDAAKPASPKKRLNRKLIVMIAAGTALLAGGGGAAAYFMIGKKHEDAEQVEKKPEHRKAPVFVDLETFTVNLREPDEDRFMQVRLVAELRDEPSGEILKTMMPAVRNEILLLLGSKQAQQVSSREGKEALAQEIVAAANKVLAGTSAEKSVESVNFTHLIIQ